MDLLREWFRSEPRTPGRPVAALCRPALDLLEDRVAPTVSSISTAFNSSSIAAGREIWFSSAFRITGLNGQEATLRVDGGTITSAFFNVAVPDAIITFSATASTPTTSFDTGTNTWNTVVPLAFAGQSIFLAGAVKPVTATLPGGIQPVTWQANFTSDTPGLSVRWQWSAAVYPNFSTNLSTISVMPVNLLFFNAGTPLNYLLQGVRGGTSSGPFDFTGQRTALRTVLPEFVDPNEPQLSSLSGFVYHDMNFNDQMDSGEGIGGITMSLSFMDDQNNVVVIETETDANGFYQFVDLQPGVYNIFKGEDPFGLDDGPMTVGTAGGFADEAEDAFTGIVLAPNVQGENYLFGHVTGG